MRSLTVKLTLAFLLVGVAGVLLVAAVVRFYTQRAFNALVLNMNQQALLVNLIRYYEANGSWDGVELVFQPGMSEGNSPGGDPEGRWDSRRTLFVITDPIGRVVFGESIRYREGKLTERQLKNAIPIQSNGKTIGWIVLTPVLDRWFAGTPEGDFLLGVQRAIWVTSLVATGIALVLGGILAFTLTKSLRTLTSATQEITKGRLGLQVDIQSQDELGQLAQSFNQMSTQLAHSVELRRQMTADIAHDLRTPLSVILGYTEALTDGKLQPDAEMYSVMHTEAQHLGHLVDDLKVLSLADAGELPLNLQPVAPARLVKRAAEAYQVQAEQGQVTLEASAAPDLPEIKVDVERMAQVLGNLVSNALRYTPPGGRIELSASQQGANVVLVVADTGVGIKPEDLPYIFERSYRGDKARRQGYRQGDSPNAGETGLGLTIARSLIEAQGGSIQVSSGLELGTTFKLTFPAVLPA
jgi:two-component system, OmpR family, sensor histidine kinase BaeS